MRLQSDPTIIYGIVGGQGQTWDAPSGSLTSKKRRLTTPIGSMAFRRRLSATQGREAILAVLNPAATNALYFVADGTGGHAFSETLAQHNAAVARWRKDRTQAGKRGGCKGGSGGHGERPGL